jgi:serine/threonine protein kinase
MPLQPGDHFGRYQLVSLLGKGGMGDVYRATDTVLHRPVALKLLRYVADPDSVETPKSRDGAARILREARLAAGLSHPNAISIFDVGEVEGVPFLAMEFVPGKTLRAYIGDPQIPLTRRIGWLADIARALGAAHDLGFVHRDIKPENVMVRDDGVVKVLDFGIARRLPPPIDRLVSTRTFGGPKLVGEVAIGNELEPLTAAGRVVGTPLYMAPEQMRGESLDGRADQFAWGVVAYELLTGTLPWDRDANPLKLVAQILSREIDPPITRNQEISLSLDAIVTTALAKARTRRFARMDDLVAELETLLPGRSPARGASHGVCPFSGLSHSRRGRSFSACRRIANPFQLSAQSPTGRS